MDEPVLFREVLFIRRGQTGWFLLVMACGLAVLGLVLAARGARWALVGIALGAGLFTATLFGGGETVVTSAAVLHWMRPLPRPRRIAMADIASAEIVIADFQTSMFGGWEGSRGGMLGAAIESVEGPLQVGNRAIRLHLQDGDVVQFATWKPRTLLETIRSAQEAARS